MHPSKQRESKHVKPLTYESTFRRSPWNRDIQQRSRHDYKPNPAKPHGSCFSVHFSKGILCLRCLSQTGIDHHRYCNTTWSGWGRHHQDYWDCAKMEKLMGLLLGPSQQMTVKSGANLIKSRASLILPTSKTWPFQCIKSKDFSHEPICLGLFHP